jgi:hypothetical protein
MIKVALMITITYLPVEHTMIEPFWENINHEISEIMTLEECEKKRDKIRFKFTYSWYTKGSAVCAPIMARTLDARNVRHPH